MDIGTVGSGDIGATVARLFAKAGHEVALSNSRGPETLEGLVREIGPSARAETVEGAAGFGEVVLVAIPFFAYDDESVGTLADGLRGKIVVDATNYYPPRDGRIDLGGLTSSELVAQRLPGARLVKAFNTLWSVTLAEGGRPGSPLEERLALFVAGDDEEAKGTVSRLVEEVGFAPVDTGPLREGGRKQQPGSPIYNAPMTAEEAHKALAEA